MSAIADFLNEEIEFGTPCIDQVNPYSNGVNENNGDEEQEFLLFQTVLMAANRKVQGALIISLSKDAADVVMKKTSLLLDSLKDLS